MIRFLKYLSLSVIFLIIFSSCRTVRQTQTEYVYIDRTDTLFQSKLRTDSIVMHDSIVTLIKGDTIQIERWHTKIKERLCVDTVEKVLTETVYQTKKEIQVKEVDRLPLRYKIVIGSLLLLLLSASILLLKRN